MAFVTWEWNRWLDALEAGEGEPFSKGLEKTVRTHKLIQKKTPAQVSRDYGADTQHEHASISIYADLEGELAEKVLSDRSIRRHRRILGDHAIGRRIYRTLTNLLTDRWRRRRGEEAIFTEVGSTSHGHEESKVEDFFTRFADPSPSLERRCIAKDLLMSFYANLTQRQQAIVAEYKEFQGERTVSELGRTLKLGKSRIYEEINQIRIKLINALALSPMSAQGRNQSAREQNDG